MTRPAWAPTCTCGATPLGYFCYPCHAWAGASHGEQSSWSNPRVGTKGSSQGDILPGSPADVMEDEAIVAAIPLGVRCSNGRYARAVKAGEKALPCGCPLAAAPRECVDAVATKTVTARRVGLDH